ncbi:hypothetical protein [Thalassobacillus sp. CUG 92003]|uniref:hypothetical protein n=1 Tax=Thalassobacillus sp. CUG 92003 TaxID=2736641 RepID=UPI0015E7A652|nr:hypothetical protein [Thalassobacillus sp. CUG 92003]
MTDLEQAWNIFTQMLQTSPLLDSFQIKSITGLPFVYLTTKPDVGKADVDEQLKKAAARSMRGKRLTLAMQFVRKNQTSYIYRIRFLVPQRKMFCCGNLCDDCIRFTP